MKWTSWGKYAQLSDCERYSVSKDGSPSGRFTYVAWRTKSHPLGRLMLACNLPDAATAKARCEHDRLNP